MVMMGREIFVHFGEVIPEYGWIRNFKKKEIKFTILSVQ